MRPTTSEWPVLSYTSGLNIGAVGVEWITAAAEGVDWTSLPVAGFGVDYGPALGPAGADTEIFLQTALMPPAGLYPGGNIRELSVPDAPVAALTEGWAFRVMFETPDITVPNVPEVFIGCGEPGGDGGFARLHWEPGLLAWQADLYDPTIPWWVVQWTGAIGTSFTFGLVRESGSSTVKLLVNNVCVGEHPAISMGVVPPEWQAFFPGPYPAAAILYQDQGAPVGQEIRVTGWLIGPTGIRPVANAGPDKVLPLSRVLGFDGGQSYDPDNGTLGYEWKLVRAPSSSVFVYEGTGAVGASLIDFVSTGLVANVSVGDILVIEGGEYEITNTVGLDTVEVDRSLPVGYSGPFVVVLQSLVVGSTTRYFALTPDKTGLYVARLEVTDEDGLSSAADLAVANVVGTTSPLRVPLDMGFLWEYIGDFWQVVENKEWAQDAWVALARIVSSHLHDLWNIDFDKSLATTQNVVMRRWLPYPPRVDVDRNDSPEFHDLRCNICGNGTLTAVQIATLFTPGPSVITISFYTPVGVENVTVAVPGGTFYRDLPDVATAGFAAQGFTAEFSWREADPPTNTDPSYFLFTCWVPDYYATISGPGFAVGQSNVFEGSNAYCFGNNAVILDDPPRDLDRVIAVGDVLDLGGRSYRIAAVSSAYVATPSFPGLPYRTRTVIKLDEVLPDWVLVGMNTTTGVGVVPIPWAIPSYWKTLVTDWYDQGVTPGDHIYAERRTSGDDAGPFTVVALTAYGAGADKLCTSDPAVFYDEYDYTPTYARRYFYLPVGDEVLDIPALQEAPNDPPWIMEQHLHYVVARRRDRNMVVLNHRAEPTDEISVVTALRDRTDAAFLTDVLWAEITHVDNRDVVEANFGRMVSAWVQDYSGVDANYLSTVTALWMVYSGGPTPLNIERSVGIMSGVPYSEAAGTVLDVVTDFLPNKTYMLIRDAERSDVVRSYVFPTGDGVAINPTTGVAYVVGDTVARFALLVGTQLYFDYLDDPDWWIGLRSVGVITEPEKVHNFGVFLDARYLNIELVTKIINFILDFKKTHTFPVFAIVQRLADTFGITDDVQLGVTLVLKDHLWDHAAPPILDYPRLGSGIRISTGGTGDREDDILIRVKTPGDTGAPSYTVRGIAWAAASVSVVGNDVTLKFIRGVTDSDGAIMLLNTVVFLEAYHPTGAVAPWTPLIEEFGPVIVNHRGLPQVHFDDRETRPASETTSYILNVNNPPVTLLGGAHGSQVLSVATAGTDGITYRVGVLHAGAYFHDGATPALSDIVCRSDWVEVRSPAGADWVYRAEGYIVGHGQGLVAGTPTDFGEALPDNWVHIQVDPSLPAPQVGDSVVLYGGTPVNRFMNWLNAPNGYGPAPGLANIYLGSEVFDNEITNAALVAGPADYQLQVSGAGGAPPRFFKPPLPATWSPLRPGDDHFVYYDAAGALRGIGVLLSVDAADLVTIRLQPGTNPDVPVTGGFFRVIRKPVTSFMTADFRRHLSAFGPQGDNLFLRQSVTPTSP